MRMKVPKMRLDEFLELSKGLGQDPRFTLVNQDIEDGFVKFRSEERLNTAERLANLPQYGDDSLLHCA